MVNAYLSGSGCFNEYLGEAIRWTAGLRGVPRVAPRASLRSRFAASLEPGPTRLFVDAALRLGPERSPRHLLGGYCRSQRLLGYRGGNCPTFGRRSSCLL